MKARSLLVRYILLFLGLAVMALSVALSRNSGLGTSPISCIPCVLSYVTPWTIGQLTAVLNFMFVLVQIALLRREFELIQLLQVVVVAVFGALIDMWVELTSGIPMDTYAQQWFWCIVSFFCSALGVLIEIKAHVLTLPGEGIVLAVVKVLGTPFSRTKIAFDSLNVIIGVVISLSCLGMLMGVREGTIAAALCVGLIVKFYSIVGHKVLALVHSKKD